MIPPYKLSKLHPRQRLRKSALLFEEAERALHLSDRAEILTAAEYAGSLASWLADDPDFPDSLRPLAHTAAIELSACIQLMINSSASFCLNADSPALRALNRLRHALLHESGQAPADWDLLAPAPGAEPGTFSDSTGTSSLLGGPRDPSARHVFPGVKAYLEDIRSPFNIGSMLRSADAFGLEELILSSECADPRHPRALRSAMGATDLVPQRRAGLEALDEAGGQAFALELGGTPMEDFIFPERGIVVVGSEELGVSAEARAKCRLGLVSIPMYGAKGSLNAGVAFGILLNAWATQLARKKQG